MFQELFSKNTKNLMQQRSKTRLRFASQTFQNSATTKIPSRLHSHATTQKSGRKKLPATAKVVHLSLQQESDL
jgi:hypothetical protein